MRMFKSMKYCIGVFLLVLFCKSGQAQDTLTIETAIATALQNGYDIQLARNDSIIASVNYSYANYAFLPTLSGNSTLLTNKNIQSSTYTANTVTKRVGTNNTNANIAAQWVLFNGFRMFVSKSYLKELLDL